MRISDLEAQLAVQFEAHACLVSEVAISQQKLDLQMASKAHAVAYWFPAADARACNVAVEPGSMTNPAILSKSAAPENELGLEAQMLEESQAAQLREGTEASESVAQ